MAVAMKIACLVMVCMVAASVTEAITCNDITPKLVSCVPYLQKGGTPTGACCGGVKAVKNAASTPADRKIACGCLKSAASSFKVNNGYAASLPGKCGVSIPYAISPSTDCSKIK